MPPQAWAFEPDVCTFTYDPARAKQLLDEAGYRDPDGDGPLPRLRLSLKISTNEETRLQATVIQQDLRARRHRSRRAVVRVRHFYADVLKGNFQMFSLQWVGGAWPIPTSCAACSTRRRCRRPASTAGYYSNPEVDRLIDLATAALTEEERRAKYYGEAQKLIAEDAPYIPIWNRMNVIAGAARVHRAAPARRRATSRR